MKFILFMVLLSAFDLSAADEPQIILTYQNSHNFYATVAGRVVGPSPARFLVTVENAGLKYTTISDESGSFGIVFRHLALRFNVSAKNFSNSGETPIVLRGTLPKP